jgi:hypothetical protein
VLQRGIKEQVTEFPARGRHRRDPRGGVIHRLASHSGDVGQIVIVELSNRVSVRPAKGSL